MKVLCILDNLSIDSGVSSIVLNLYRNMDLKKVQMDFLVCNKQEESFESEIKKRGGKVFYVGNFLVPSQTLSAILKTKNFFKKHANEYNIVHLHSPTLAMFTLKYAKMYGIPIRIVHSHSTMMSTNKLKNVINAYLIKQIKKYANEFFACSTEAAHFLYGEEFCNTHKIKLIHNAVNCFRFIYDREVARSMRKTLDISDNTVFINVSNYSPIKNHYFLLDIIERFKVVKKSAKFLFVGNGQTRHSFEAEIKKRDLIDLCVFIDKTLHVEQYLCVADAMILPSLKEGLPVALIEGQAAGLPFFTSDTVTREANVGKGEFIPLISEKWFEKLNNFEPLSAEERADNSEKFRESVFNIEIEAARVTNIYQQLVKGENKL